MNDQDKALEQEALAELTRNMADPMWRLSNLYKIQVKDEGDPEAEARVITFKPNRAQRRLLNRLWNRNVILKARQLGFTTLIAVLFLDHALFNNNVRCGMIAQDREAAEVIFRDKVLFAYENLPEPLRAAMPLKNRTKTELLFGHNNSSIRVATSVRSGTIHMLHVSEFGKICAKFPDKAKEVMTGSIPAVPLSGMIFIESTAEGQSGEFFNISQRAESQAQAKKQLTERDYRFHFYPWWEEPNYRMAPEGVTITEKDHAYFAEIEAAADTTLSLEQRAWYVATRDADYPGNPERMWQEYPSTSKEAFQQSTEGTYYKDQLATARKQNRIGFYPHLQGTPVNTIWDIGSADGTAIWFHQRIGNENRFIKFIEGWGEPYSYFVNQMQATGFIWGKHFLPHDAKHKRQQGNKIASPEDMLYDLGLRNIEIVPVVDEVIHGIQLVRDQFNTYTFDETGCKDGIAHLGQYRKEWNERLGAFKSTPLHDIHSEAADAIRQLAQAQANGMIGMAVTSFKRKQRSWRTS